MSSVKWASITTDDDYFANDPNVVDFLPVRHSYSEILPHVADILFSRYSKKAKALLQSYDLKPSLESSKWTYDVSGLIRYNV